MRTLLVVGSAPCVWDDVEAFWELEIEHDVCTVNHTALYYPCWTKYWCSYETYIFQDVIDDIGCDHKISACDTSIGVEYYKLYELGGSSSLHATSIALEYLNYDRVVLAGVPITNEVNVISGASMTYYDQFFVHWQRMYDRWDGRVFSMSGNTKDLFGTVASKWRVYG